MKKIFFVRHAQSQANADGIMAGSEFETPLTEEGKDQARKAGQYLKSSGVQLIVASPMQRTQQTAKIIAKEIGMVPEAILTNPLLTERSFGPYDGQPFAKYAQDVDRGSLTDGVETTAALFERVEKMFQWLAKRPEKTILVVSHGATGRMFRLIDQKMHHKDFHTIQRFDNAEIDEFTL